MFGGHGVYADGVCFAIEQAGEVFLKIDDESRPRFAAAGSTPFVYSAKGQERPTSFWRLPESAYDDEAELKRWAALGLEAARRAAARKAPKAGERRRAGRAAG